MSTDSKRQEVVNMLYENRKAAGRTAIHRNAASAPLKRMLGLGYFAGERKILDHGCGHGADVVALRDAGFDAVGFDPNHAPDTVVRPGTCDVVLSTYVLNTLPTVQERGFVLDGLLAAAKPGGKIFVTVRADVKRDGWTSKGTYQATIDVVAELQRKGIEGLVVVKNSNFVTTFFTKASD